MKRQSKIQAAQARALSRMTHAEKIVKLEGRFQHALKLTSRHERGREAKKGLDTNCEIHIQPRKSFRTSFDFLQGIRSSRLSAQSASEEVAISESPEIFGKPEKVGWKCLSNFFPTTERSPCNSSEMSAAVARTPVGRTRTQP